MKKRILCLLTILAILIGYTPRSIMTDMIEATGGIVTQDEGADERDENTPLSHGHLILAEKNPLWNTEEERILVESLNKDSATLLSTSQINATPYPSFELSYNSSVSAGTIRFISQVPGSSYFKSAYWPTHSFGSYSSPISECGTASISMALSYIGVNKTPKEILEYDNGRTWITKNWGEAEYKTSDFNTAISNYINGDGKYSPPIICLKPSPYSDNQHFVLVAGKVNSTQYVIVDPGCNSQDTMTISGSDWSQYWGKKHTSGKITGVYQYHNKNATGAPTPTPTPTPISAPTSATLTIDNSEYFIDEPFTLTFSADQPCDYYWLSIYDVDTSETVMGTRIEGTNSLSTSFKKAGHYSAHMAAVNQSGTANSNWVEFWVYGSDAPSRATLSVSKTAIPLGESVSFTSWMDTFYAIYYMAIYENNANELVDSGWKSQSYTFTPLKPGRYSAGMSAYTKAGTANSNWAIFRVFGDYENLGTDFYAYIRNVKTSRNIVVDGNNVQLSASQTDSNNQPWKFERQSDGSYTILSAKDGYALSVETVSAEEGTNIVTRPAQANSIEQKWFIEKNANNGTDYILISPCGYLVMDVKNSSVDNESNIQLNSYYNSDAEGFAIQSVETPTSVTLTIDNSEYFIDEPFTLTFASDQPCDYYWLSIYDVDTGETVIGTRVEGTNSYSTSFKKAGHYSSHMAAVNQSGTANSNWVEFWVYGPDAPSKATLSVSKSAIPLGESVSFTSWMDTFYAIYYMSIYENNENELADSGWKSQSYTFTPLKPGRYSAGMSAYTKAGTAHSNWAVFRVFGEYENLGTGFYAYICNTKTSQNVCRDANNVQITVNNNQTDAINQIWKFERQADGSYFILSAKDGCALSVETASAEEGTNIVTAPVQVDSSEQKWFVEENVHNGTDYIFINPCGYFVMDVKNSAADSESNIQLNSYDKSDAQGFTVQRIDSPVLSVSRNGNSVTANIVCPDNNAIVFCGVYNNSGKMLAVRSAQITGESNYQFQFDGQQFDYAKAFIVDSDFRPLCESKRTD